MDAEQKPEGYLLVGVNPNGNKFVYAGFFKPQVKEEVERRLVLVSSLEVHDGIKFIIEKATDWGIESQVTEEAK